MRSAVAGAALLCCAGCTTHRALELDARHPAIAVTPTGVTFGDELVKVAEVPEILEDYEVPHDRVIHIHLDPAVRDLGPARRLMVTLARSGYTRPVLVTTRHAESQAVIRKRKR